MPDFQKGLKAIVDCIEDLSQLNVKTFTGTIKSAAADQKLEDLMDAALASGELEVVAFTTMKIDGDVDQYISNSKTVTDGLRDAHTSAVQSGDASRKATLSLFGKVVRAAIDKEWTKLP